MEITQITNPSGLGEELAVSVEGQPKCQRTFFVQTLGPPKGAGRSVAEAGVEAATQPPQD